METEEIVETIDAHSRFKGACWYSNIQKKDVVVIGNGGIGSWLSLLLSRTGATIHTFDFDSFDSINMAGQLVRNQDIGKNKTEAIREIISEFCNSEADVYTYPEKYTSKSMTNNIVIMGVDNMEARKIGFQNWVKYLEENPEERVNSLFIDGRLSMTKLQIFCIKGNDTEAIRKYQAEHLFDDSEVLEEECTAKQTSHCACMIASHMVGFLTNYLSPNSFEVPFFWSYFIPLNYIEDERA